MSKESTPEGIGVTPGAEAAGVSIKLVGAHVILDYVAGGTFLHFHALVAVRSDGVTAHYVPIAPVLSVRPLDESRQTDRQTNRETSDWCTEDACYVRGCTLGKIVY